MQRKKTVHTTTTDPQEGKGHIGKKIENESEVISELLIWMLVLVFFAGNSFIASKFNEALSKPYMVSETKPKLASY
jgi:hypothetical protein